MPDVFKKIDEETKGAIKWKLIAGGQIADGKAHVHRGQGRPDAGAASASSTYVPNAMPSVYAIYSTIIFGENDRRSRRRGAAIETMYLQLPLVPRGDEEDQRRAARRLDQSSAYLLACREPIKTSRS